MGGGSLTGGFPVAAVIHGEIIAVAPRGREDTALEGELDGLVEPGAGEAMGFLRAVKEKEAVDIIAFIRRAENRLELAIENSGAVIEMVRPDYAFREKDILYLSGSKEGILKLAEWAQ